MIGYILYGVLTFFVLSYFVFWPVFEYFRDPKGLRKYPNLNILSGITDLSFIYEAHKGFRSQALLEAHQKSPVVRIGPNSLSYSSISAIKVYSLLQMTEIVLTGRRIFMAITQNVSKMYSTIHLQAPTTILPTREINSTTNANAASCQAPTLSRISKDGNTKSPTKQPDSSPQQMHAAPKPSRKA
jgi:hypothetical protein